MGYINTVHSLSNNSKDQTVVSSLRARAYPRTCRLKQISSPSLAFPTEPMAAKPVVFSTLHPFGIPQYS